MNYDGWPHVILGKKKLGGKSHFTKDRFLSMLIRAFISHDRVILQANASTEEIAIGLIHILKFVGIETEDRFVERKIIDGEEKEIITFVLDKLPSIRGIK